MPLVTKPDPLPSELTYVPENGKPHIVSSGESWWTLVELRQVRAARKSASDCVTSTSRRVFRGRSIGICITR